MASTKNFDYLMLMQLVSTSVDPPSTLKVIKRWLILYWTCTDFCSCLYFRHYSITSVYRIFALFIVCDACRLFANALSFYVFWKKGYGISSSLDIYFCKCLQESLTEFETNWIKKVLRTGLPHVLGPSNNSPL